MNDDVLNWTNDLPYGLKDLEENAASKYATTATSDFIKPDQIRCCVRHCDRWLSRRRRGQLKKDSIYCEQHGISVSTSPTYIYKDYRRNFIIGQDRLNEVKKVESWRLGNENSEDALTWNLFVGMLQLGGLRSLFECLTGITPQAEPELYLWGNRIGEGAIHPWPDLLKTRSILEDRAGLPTEPDAALRVPGQALALIEAKFGSPNGSFEGKTDRFGDIRDYLGRYYAKEDSSDPLNREWIEMQNAGDILEQLCRNVIFAHWLAKDGEKVCVVNLVSKKAEVDIEQRFAKQIVPEAIHFSRAEWEQIYMLPEIQAPEGALLRQYMENKTLRLAKAFELSPSS